MEGARFFDDLDRQLRDIGDARPGQSESVPYAEMDRVRPPAFDEETVVRGRPGALEILHQLSEVLGTRNPNRGQLLEALLDGAIALTGAERGLVVLTADEAGRELAVELARGRGGATMDPARFDFSRTIIGHVLESGEPLHVPRTALDARFSQIQSVARLKIHSIMCAPLRLWIRRGRPPRTERRRAARGVHRVLGAIYLDSSAGDHEFSAAELGVFETLANHATSVLAHYRYFDEATTDRLTGLVNRRQLTALLGDECQVARRGEVGFTYAVLDLDRFRLINEGEGFRRGDEVLRGFARVLERSLRRIDIACRYGADKFGVLLPETDAGGADEVIGRIREAAQEDGVPLSFTAGVAICEPGESLDVAELLLRADQALWAAKSSGRRQQVWEAGLARVAGRADRLAGILTGDWATDYRNVLALLEALTNVGEEQALDELVITALDSAVGLVDAERGLLLLADPPSGVAEVASRGHDRTTRTPDPLDEGIARRVLGDNRSLRIDEREVRMAAPLEARGEVLGAIVVSRPGSTPFDENEATFFLALARELANAVASARLAEENRAKQRQIEAFNRRLTAKVEQATFELAVARRALGERYRGRGLVGRSPAMRRVGAIVDKVAGSTLPVLIQGESGTGKEVVARTIHHSGPRSDERFLSENCAALSPTLMESELFGHVKGAFTGASSDRVGLFERADGGTLFLDEIGDMPLELQAKLLRALESGEIRPVGGDRSKTVDVRILAATNKDLRAACREGDFREDLYFRLAVVTVDLPPLRERLDDLPLLVAALLEDREDVAEQGVRLDGGALAALAAHDWPGNVRELRNVLDQLLLFREDGEITARDVQRALGGERRADEMPSGLGDEKFKDAKRAFERAYLARALARHEGNISRTSAAIGVDRRYLYDLLDKHGLRQSK